MATSLRTFDQALAVGTTPVIGLDAALDIVMPMIKNRSKTSEIDLATGVAYNESGNCDVDGTYSFTGDETDDGTNYSDTFTATFTNCDDGFDFIIDGSLSGTSTENYDTGDYTENVSGSLSVTIISSYRHRQSQFHRTRLPGIRK